MTTRDPIKCPDCHSTILPSRLKDHILLCKSYKGRIYGNTFKIAQCLSQDDIHFLLAEVDLAKEHLEGKLSNGKEEQAFFDSYLTEKLEKEEVDDEEVYSKSFKRIKEQSHDEMEEIKVESKHSTNPSAASSPCPSPILEPQPEIKYEEKCEMIVCMNCSKKIANENISEFIYSYVCFHIFCKECLSSYVNDKFIENKGIMKCLVKTCKEDIPMDQIRETIGNKQIDILETNMLRQEIDFIQCCKCKNEFEFTEGNIKDAPKTNGQGKKLDKKYLENYAKNRFICPSPGCKSEQCRMCGASPYHLDRTCEENEEFLKAVKCRYCGDMIKAGYTSNLGIKAFNDICSKKACEKMTKSACSKIHKCKHSCFGYIGEKKCLPCLHPDCAKENKVSHEQNEDSYCSICYTEDLKSHPCVQSECGHIFHYSCLLKRLELRWLTPRIQFNYCSCPLCKEWIKLQDGCGLNTFLEKGKELKELIRKKSFQRLKFEKLEKDEKIMDKSSIYFNKPEDYANAIYAYFECFKCKKPYFGGKKSCSEQLADPGPNSDASYDASKLLCPECCSTDLKSCPKHGEEYITFKCKFCCNFAVWCCWGNTHFCDSCHEKQLKGEYISKKTKEELPACLGDSKCPLGGKHGGNGEEHCIGCIICLRERDENGAMDEL